MASVKLEDCSQTLELNVNIKDEEEEEKIRTTVNNVGNVDPSGSLSCSNGKGGYQQNLDTMLRHSLHPESNSRKIRELRRLITAHIVKRFSHFYQS
ncbi:uncharacterized protein isoform X2 [Salmo salar]|uniref:Uncharacterized protein isoform X2 n=1 Tax=Salmo salar TaxID=8030 RepID=A0ABM3D1N9_SALSA|nr:uncharacterized protein LOC123727742 isoform X2 [Salmo salar]